MVDLNRESGLTWFTSSYSGNGSTCVEVAALGGGAAAVRDTKARGTGPVLSVSPATWRAFVRGAAHGGLDR
jgi:hypothetical protein